MRLYVELLKLYGKDTRQRDIIYSHIGKMLSNLIRTDEKYSLDKLGKVLDIFPDQMRVFILSQYTEQKNTLLELQAKKQDIETPERNFNDLEIAQKSALTELDNIKGSKLWKVRKASGKVRSLTKALKAKNI